MDSLDDEPHMAFEITGDSMYDGSIDSIPNKAIVLGVEVDIKEFTLENNGLLNKPYVLVCKDRIVCKQIKGYSVENETIQCGNLNQSPEYQDFDLATDNVLQPFRIAKRQL